MSPEERPPGPDSGQESNGGGAASEPSDPTELFNTPISGPSPPERVVSGRIGAFQIERELGRGGMGVVYLARDERLNRDVALKTLTALEGDGSARLARFRREAVTVAQLNHPHIAHIHQLIEHDGALFLVLEYVPGDPLTKRIRTGAIRGADETVRILAQVADAVSTAHERGVIHRDLKPSNIMITPEGTAKVLDFGLASRFRSADTDSVSDAKVDAIADAGGTPGYMAPEQSLGMAPDARADIFSLGCILFECLTGVQAFPGSTPEEKMIATRESIPDWTKLPSDLAPSLREVVRSSLSKAVDDRPATCAAFRGQLIGTPLEDVRSEVPADEPTTVHLPQFLDRFVGRETALAELAPLTESNRVLTLVGMGGAGKTRLAVELARRRAAAHLDGVYSAELAGVEDPTRVASIVAAALGLSDEVTRTPEVAVGAHVSNRAILLLMDSCEQVIDEAARLISLWLRQSAEFRVLATSRVALEIEGEAVWSVPPLRVPEGRVKPQVELTLSDPAIDSATSTFDSIDLDVAGQSEAVALFVDRARSARPSFELTEENVLQVAKICRRIDGVPLAIELAAARIRTLSPIEILEHLDDRFRLLTQRVRGRADRHRSLRDAIVWSYEQLEEPERDLFQALSAFAGGWPLAGAVRLAMSEVDRSGDLEVLDILTSLVQSSLVVVERSEDVTRYRMLESVREFGRRELEQRREFAERITSRMLDHLSEFAKGTAQDFIAAATRSTALRSFDEEHENCLNAIARSARTGQCLEPAMETVGALHSYWAHRGYARTGLSAARSLVPYLDSASASVIPPMSRAKVLNAAAVFAQDTGEHDEAESYYGMLLNLMAEIGIPRAEITITMNYGTYLKSRGEYERARGFYDRALRLARSEGDSHRITLCLHNLASLLTDLGEYESAKSCLAEEIQIGRDLQDHGILAGALTARARCCQDEAESLQAIEDAEEALPMLREAEDTVGIARCLITLANARMDSGSMETARAALEEARVLKVEIGDRQGEAVVFVNSARLELRSGNESAARKHVARAVEILREARSTRVANYLLLVAAAIEERAGNLAKATRHRGAAEASRESIGIPLPKSLAKDHLEALLDLKKGLGEAEFEEAWMLGRETEYVAALDETLRS